MLLVHAHPDDEAIGTGAIMAKYAAAGVHVALVTCTLGEEGEVLVPDLEHLHASQRDALGSHRKNELAVAMDVLGVADWRLLGGPGKYRDSGMFGEATNDSAGCFWRADLLEAAADLVSVIRELRPQVLITYDESGGYGHPDHIQAHRVAMYAAVLAAAASFRPDLGEAWDTPKIYWTAVPNSVVRRGIEMLGQIGDTSAFAEMDADDVPFAIADGLVTTAVDARDWLPQKMAAMREYPTQIELGSGFFALSQADDSFMGVEHFRLVRGPLGPVDEAGRETDLFGGLPAR